MAIDLTTSSSFIFKPILATSPVLPDNKYKPNKVMHEWTWQLQGTGDASGGGVNANVDFGTYFDKNHYVVITFISYNSAANTTCIFSTNTDGWDNMYTPGIADASMMLWKPDGSYNPSYDDMLKKPLYLGRPRQQDANPGLAYVYFATNTNGSSYRALIMGFTLERPLPFSSILQP